MTGRRRARFDWNYLRTRFEIVFWKFENCFATGKTA
jgi:hypothetical protein